MHTTNNLLLLTAAFSQSLLLHAFHIPVLWQWSLIKAAILGSNPIAIPQTSKRPAHQLQIPALNPYP